LAASITSIVPREVHLTVSKQSFALGEAVDKTKLLRAGCQKVSWLERRITKVEPDQKAWWAKNPTCYLDAGFEPVDGRQGFELRPKLGLMTILGGGVLTSAYLYYGPVGLEMVKLAVSGSDAVTDQVLHFNMLCEATFGEPTFSDDSQNLLPRNRTWTLAGRMQLASELDPSGKRAWFAWTVEDREVLAN
jgi:hypothetical protein